jgi:phospholipase C
MDRPILECGMTLRLPTAAGATLVLGVALAFGANLSAQRSPAATAPASGAALQGIHKIQHVIVIMQENRSFDSYFGVYPGAIGIPMQGGVPTVCVPDPMAGDCVKPFADHHDSTQGGPHTSAASAKDIDHGKMDGFIAEAETRCGPGTGTCKALDVMGYHTGTDIPNYWAYAKNFVLNDMMFESDHSWSLPSHLGLVSGWTARCASQDPMSCTGTDSPQRPTQSDPTPYVWTDLTWLLHKYHVTWGYYLDHGAQTGTNPNGVPQIWSVLPGFSDVHQDGQTGKIMPLTSFMTQAKAGTLPQVSWIVPNVQDSEHPPAKVSTGQAYVTRIINAVMSSSDWNSSAIFLAWDDWSGMYDNVVPPTADALGYGIRVPALVISPYARRGLIDSQTLSFDAYLKFIEDDFLGGARLDPATDGRPDSRTVVRENLPILGNLVKDFNFSQAPLPALILNPCPPNTTLIPTPQPGCTGQVKMPRNLGDS